MIKTIYIIILSYFILGAIAFYFINRKKEKADARRNRTKYITYFLIIHILFFSIVLHPLLFRILAVAIILTGFSELCILFRRSSYSHKKFFILAAFSFLLFAAGLFYFSGMQTGIVLFSFLILSIFDSFSQISGQLFGKTRVMPKVSPNKTVEGLAGGALIALISAFLLRNLVNAAVMEILAVALGIIFFAFVGDLSASYYKRRYNAKDFSNFIPGHGGILDRFDSLIFGGTWVALYELVINI
ncbi:MAG: phosphatidate cytidylyltransferase [Prolixibacteraceae bacterium]